MTDWVTIKIPEETRDKAREDPRTYGEIVEAGLDSPEPALSHGSELDADALAESVGEILEYKPPEGDYIGLDDIRESVRTIEERIGRIERSLEGLGAV